MNEQQHVYSYGKAEETNGYMVYMSVVIDRVPKEYISPGRNGNYLGFKRNLEVNLIKISEFVASDVIKHIKYEQEKQQRNNENKYKNSNLCDKLYGANENVRYLESVLREHKISF